MSNTETHEEMLVNTNLFDFKVGNSVGQSRSNRDPYFHLVFDEEHDNTNFTRPTNIELDENEETIKIYFDGNSENEPRSLSGRRFEDNMDEVDDDDAEKSYLLIFDEETKTYTLECLDYEFHISNDFSADVNGISQKPEASYDEEEFERELKSQLMQKGTEEDNQPYIPDDFADEEEDDGYEEKFREVMEIEGNGENGISNDTHEYEDDGDTWMEDDHLEEVDAPSPQALSPAPDDDMYGPIEDEGDVIKDDITGSSNSSSTATSSSSSESENSGDEGSDSTESQEPDRDFELEAQMNQLMNNTAKSSRTKPNSNVAGRNPISLGAYLGVEEQDQDGSSDDSDY